MCGCVIGNKTVICFTQKRREREIGREAEGQSEGSIHHGQGWNRIGKSCPRQTSHLSQPEGHWAEAGSTV